ncbi:MAG: alpha-ketoacid dehydrogenase subunit beta [Deltaproteobacteria bacterium]|nr:MAG: alpha-ketoacid dehydrogenase subunit beta [Deltaproteobacteria bacterium]
MHRQSAGRRRSVAGRGFDLPDERALARRSRQVPAGGGARRLVEEGPRRALPGPVGRDGNRGERPARHRARRGARGGRGYRGRQGLSAFGGRGHREGRVGRRRIVVAELTYRDAVAAGIAQEMARDESVVFLGEDIGAAGGVFKTTLGLLERFGPRRVRDTPISEQAIIGAAMGAAMTGLRPIAEIMFSDFFAVCWDMIANEIAKTRYMTAGQIALPLVIRTANGYGSRFGAQHSQSVENWAMAIPGLKVVAPSTPLDVKGLLAAAVRDPDPVIFFEHKGLYSTKGEVPDGEIVDRLGTAKVVRQGEDVTIVALAAMVPKSLQAAERLAAEDGISATVVDVRSLVPLDTKTIFEEVRKTGRLYTVEENPRLCGWGAEIASLVAEECFYDLDGPIVRITTPHVPLPAADLLEDNAVPTVDRIVETVRRNAG